MLTRELPPAAGEGLGHRVRIELSSRLLAEARTASFPPELEIEYLRFHRQRVFALMRLGLGLVPLLYLGAFVIDAQFTRYLQSPMALLLCFGIGAPSAAVLFVMVHRPAYRELGTRFAPLCNLVNGLIVVALCVQAQRSGKAFHYELLTLVFAYTFFLGGVRPRAAVTVASLLIVAYGVAMHLSGLPRETLTWHLYMLLSLATLGTLGSVMLDRSQRRFWLQRVLTTELSVSDGLTGLHNHRYLKEQGDAVLRHAARELRPVSLLLIDVDAFKAYNDSQGHLAGDDCLRRLALLIESTGRRPLDIAARYGGEEFAVMMYDCAEPQARRRAQELCAEIERANIAHPASSTGFISVSIGVAAGIPSLASELESFTRLADAALYAAKAQGRNRVESSPLVAGL